jgi:hypothetical protein
MYDEEVSLISYCCGCETSSSYFFGSTCGNCGHTVKGVSCNHKGGSKC